MSLNVDNEGFLTDAATAAIFYRFCARYKITSPADRVLVFSCYVNSCAVRRLHIFAT